MTNQELAYSEVERLVKDFKNIPTAKRKGINEMQTRNGYILPLFKALGWDTSNINEVNPEEKVSRGWVDFSFRIGNVPRFFLETKRVDEDLNNPAFVKQAIDYAWTKSVTWALLSDFEGLRVFNAEWKESDPFRAQFFEFGLDDYLKDFERLWWLSKTETVSRRLDIEAEKVGKKIKRLPVSQNLFDDLKRWREHLFKNYKAFNLGYSAAQVDEAVLRLLNRLIFIRTAEDREVENNRLRSLVRVLRDKKQIQNLDVELAGLFRELDGVYNSELFSKHFSEELKIPPTDLEEIINGLYEKNYTRYNFNALDADILGTAYEQYLGHVVAEGEGETHVEEKRTKRKSQGIYYTPTFVTKYIVQQTVGKYLEENGYNHSKPPRVLDMACGSGSFLIEAFDVIDNFVAKQRGQAQKGEVDFYDRVRQMEVLQNCIFGVDKDKQAVEVARLNLLLRGLHSREKLPMLENIRYADSLRDKDLIDNPSYDIIIGNPPYIRAENMAREERDYYMAGDFETAYGKFDIFILFLERAIKLLKEGGRLGFIIPYAGLTQNYGLLLRKFILDTCVIKSIVDFSEYKVFADASIATCILVLRKESNLEKRVKNSVLIIKQSSYEEGIVDSGNLLTQITFLDTQNNTFRLNLTDKILRLAEKIDKQSLRLGDICYLITGAVLHDSKTGESKERLISASYKKGYKHYIEAKELSRYVPPVSTRFLDYRPEEMHRPKFIELFENEKIMIARISSEVKATLDLENLYTDHTVDLAVRKDKLVNAQSRDFKISKEEENISKNYDLKYLLGIINSKIASWYLNNLLSMAIEINPETGRQLPIYRIDFKNTTVNNEHDEIVKLVEKMLALKKERQAVRREDEFDHVRNLEHEIARIDEEIDKGVYEMYGLTDEEIKIVEGN